MSENNFEIYIKVNLKEGTEILEKILDILKVKQPFKRILEITEWPYWCWNCKVKIEKKEDAVKGKGDVLECPKCGVQIPEP